MYFENVAFFHAKLGSDHVCIIYTAKDKKSHINVSMTLTFKVGSHVEVKYFGFFVIPDLEKVRIDTNIKSVSCMQPCRVEKIILKWVWPWLWKSTVEARWLVIMVTLQKCQQWIPGPRKCYKTLKSCFYHIVVPQYHIDAWILWHTISWSIKCKREQILFNGRVMHWWIEFISVAKHQMRPLKVWLLKAQNCNHQSLIYNFTTHEFHDAWILWNYDAWISWCMNFDARILWNYDAWISRHMNFMTHEFYEIMMHEFHDAWIFDARILWCMNFMIGT